MIGKVNTMLGRLGWDIPAFALRLFPAVVFFQSGRSKVEGLTIKDSTWFLFEQEYALPLGDVKVFWRDWFAGAGAEYGSVT